MRYSPVLGMLTAILLTAWGTGCKTPPEINALGHIQQTVETTRRIVLPTAEQVTAEIALDDDLHDEWFSALGRFKSGGADMIDVIEKQIERDEADKE